MVEVSSLVLILLGETAGVLALVVLVMSFLGWRRRSKDKKAIKALIAGVNEQADAHQEALLAFLRPRCGDEGAEAALSNVLAAETGFYQSFIRLYRKRDPEAVAALHESLESLTAPFRALGTAAPRAPEAQVGEAEDDSDGDTSEAPEAEASSEGKTELEAAVEAQDEAEAPGDDALAGDDLEVAATPDEADVPEAEDPAIAARRIEELTDENTRLAHELEITRSTLNSMLEEYASVLTESNAGQESQSSEAPAPTAPATAVATAATEQAMPDGPFSDVTDQADAAPSVADELDALAADASEQGQDILDELDIGDDTDISLVDVDLSAENETAAEPATGSSPEQFEPGATASVSLDELDIELAGTDDITNADEDLAQAS